MFTVHSQQWIKSGVCTLALLLSVAFSSACRGADVPSNEEFGKAHQQLKEATRNVKGVIQVYQSDRPLRVVDGKAPEIPMVLRGEFVRHGETMRVDYVTLTHPGSGNPVQERRHSLAITPGMLYSLTEGTTPDSGMLQVYERKSLAAAGLLKNLDVTFLQPLEILWRGGGTPSVELLQNSDARILLDKSDSAREILVIRQGAKDGPDFSQLEFAPSFPYPLQRIHSRSEAEALSARFERRVSSSTVGGAYLPLRVEETIEFQPGQGSTKIIDTKIIELELEPLDENAATAVTLTRLSPESFQDQKIGYQVYYYDRYGKERLGERFHRSTPLR